MKKIYKSAAVLLTALFGLNAKAQLVSAYSFVQQSATYNQIALGTPGSSVIVNNSTSDDDVFSALPIGFNFNYAGTTYTSFAVNTNGWMSLGNTVPFSSYSPISSVGNAIAAFGRDMQLGTRQTATVTSGSNVVALANPATPRFQVGDTLQGTGIPLNTTITAIAANNMTISANATAAGTQVFTNGSILRSVTGTAPNRVFTLQWRRAGRFSNTANGLNDFLNFQIKLYETSNVVEVIYGACGTANAVTHIIDVGLRGVLATDFNSRSVLNTGTWAASTAAASNAPSCFFSATVSPVINQLYRWTPPPTCSGTPPAGSISGATLNCGGATQNLLLTNSSSTLGGITFQWSSSSNIAGPYTNLGTSLTQATGTMNTSMYYIVTTSCAAGGATAATTPFLVNFSANPTLSITASSTAAICPGGSVNLTTSGSGAATYAWSPSTGLSSTTASSVTASPNGITNYVVVATSSLGCSTTSAIVLNVNNVPSVTSVIASPSVVCAGGSSSLQVTAANTTSYAVSSITYAAIPTPSSGVTVLCNAGTASVPLSSGTLDDGGWSNLHIPFGFSFFGNLYSTFAISTNGFMVMGAGLPNTFTGYSNTFPSTTAGRPSIGANYSDLDFRTFGKIEYFVTGTSPNQLLVANWSGQFYSGTGTITTQAILYQGSNLIEVHTFTSSGTNSSVEGIQNAAGNLAFTAPARNNVTFSVSAPDAFRFAPVGVPAIYAWSPATFLSSTSISNPIATNASATTNYTVSVSEATVGCTATNFLTLTVNPLPTVAISGASAVCLGSSATLTASGATTYTWSNGPTTAANAISPTVTTVYTATGTSAAGCVGASTTTVNINTAPVVSIAGATAVCAGSSATLTASGASTYTWNNGPTTAANVVTPTASITYTATGTSTNGCTGSASQAITVNALPNVSLTASGAPTVCINTATVALTGSPAGGVISGSNVAGGVFTPGATPGTFVQNYAYTNTVTGCSNTANNTIVVSGCVGLNNVTASANGFVAYPNPTNGVFTLSFTNGLEKQITVTDLTGKVVYSTTTDSQMLDINIANLANGIYSVKVQSNQAIEVIKVVKQ